MVVLLLGLCAGFRLIFKRGDAANGGRYAPVLHGDRSNRPILDDFSTHNSLGSDAMQEEYRDREIDRDNSAESEHEVIRESDLQEIVLNPVLESYRPPAAAPTATATPGPASTATVAPGPASTATVAPSADISPPDEALQGTDLPVSK